MTQESDTSNQIMFHEPEFHCFNNSSSFSLYWKRHLFPTIEHAYHWESFQELTGLLPKAAAAEIHIARSPVIAYELAHKWEHRRRPDWDEVRDDILESLLWEKAHQHEYVMRKLLETGDRILVGDRSLGTLWMKVRTRLIETGYYPKSRMN